MSSLPHIQAFRFLILADRSKLSALLRSSAKPGGHRVHYKCTVVSSYGGQVDTADGVPLVTQSIRSLDRAEIDTLIVPGAFVVEDVTRDAKLIE